MKSHFVSHNDNRKSSLFMLMENGKLSLHHIAWCCGVKPELHIEGEDGCIVCPSCNRIAWLTSFCIRAWNIGVETDEHSELMEE